MSVLPIVLLLIAANGLLVLVEFALVRVRASRIELLARKGNSRALTVQRVLGAMDEYLAAIQVGTTLTSLALGWIGEPATARFLSRLLLQAGFGALPPRWLHGLALGCALLALSFVQIVFGELVPRSIGIQRADVMSLWGAYPLVLFTKAINVPVRFMSACSVAVVRLLGMKPAAHAESVVSEEEMRVLLGQTQEQGALPLERLLLLENLFDLGSAKVAEAMTAREKVVYLSLARTWEENLAVIRGKRFSRYPLCDNDLETVLGFIHVKDLLVHEGAPDLKKLRRDVMEVGETDSLEKLLKLFPDKGIHMAVVRDGLGRVSGILTLEDIVEELIGEVHDEFDLPQAWSLMSVVPPSAVAVGLQAEERRDAIKLLMDKLAAAEPSLKAEEALKAVWERELKFSSAVGRGVAVPHGRLLNLDRPLVAVGRFARPVPFPSPDNVPVRLVFLILTPAGTPVIQLKVLGRIASLVTNENLRRRILRAKSADSMTELLKTADTMLAS